VDQHLEIVGLRNWLGNNRGTSYDGNGDITAARRELQYSGETYRVDKGMLGYLVYRLERSFGNIHFD